MNIYFVAVFKRSVAFMGYFLLSSFRQIGEGEEIECVEVLNGKEEDIYSEISDGLAMSLSEIEQGDAAVTAEQEKENRKIRFGEVGVFGLSDDIQECEEQVSKRKGTVTPDAVRGILNWRKYEESLKRSETTDFVDFKDKSARIKKIREGTFLKKYLNTRKKDFYREASERLRRRKTSKEHSEFRIPCTGSQLGKKTAV